MINPVVVQRPLGDGAPEATLYYGASCIDSLRRLPGNSVHCMVTSPPYWGLRNYSGEPQIWGGDEGCGHEPEPCTVLDPFSGSGTTGVVALNNGRAYVGLDVNENYVDLAVARLLGEAAPSRADDDDGGGILELFGVEGG